MITQTLAAAGVAALTALAPMTAIPAPGGPLPLGCVTQEGAGPIEVYATSNPSGVSPVATIPAAVPFLCDVPTQPGTVPVRAVAGPEGVSGFVADSEAVMSFPLYENGEYVVEREVHAETFDTGRAPSVYIAPDEYSPVIVEVDEGSSVKAVALDIADGPDMGDGEYPAWWPRRGGSEDGVKGWWPVLTGDGERGFIRSEHVSTEAEMSADEIAEKAKDAAGDDGGSEGAGDTEDASEAGSKADDSADSKSGPESAASLPMSAYAAIALAGLLALLGIGVFGKRLAEKRKKVRSTNGQDME